MGGKPKSAHNRGMERKEGQEADCVPAPEQDAAARHLEDLLDAALAGTFPASDPVSGLLPSAPARRPARDEREQQADQQQVGEDAVDEPGGDERRRRRA